MELTKCWHKSRLILQLLLALSTVATQTTGDERNFSLQIPRIPGAPTNRVVHMNSSCSAHTMTVSIQMEKPFKGIVYAKDFAQECKTPGILENIITIELPTSGCGVRLSSEHRADVTDAMNASLQYTVTLVIQMDRHLRQITDQERTISCHLDADQTKLNSNSMRRAVMETIKKDIRTGRMKTEWSESDMFNDETEMQALDKARAWMEISGEDEGSMAGRVVKVGDTMVLTVKSTLPANIGWRVIDCMAHDGIGDTSQKLLDDSGCPIDDQILPELNFSPPRMIGPTTNIASKLLLKNRGKPDRTKRATVKKTGEELKQYASDFEINERQKPGVMRYQEAAASFAAFKFPDRDRLHLSCGLQLCKGECHKVDCQLIRRASRHLTEGDEKELPEMDFNDDQKNTGVQNSALVKNPDTPEEILDRLEVYNSVEVIAPEIELEDFRGRRRNGIDKTRPRPKLITIPGDRTFCVSTNKMALAFCLLGVIFIIAILVAIISLLRSRRKDSRSYYSRSVFSSSTSTGSGYGGSKLLLHESPCLGSARAWQYGRAF